MIIFNAYRIIVFIEILKVIFKRITILGTPFLFVLASSEAISDNLISSKFEEIEPLPSRAIVSHMWTHNDNLVALGKSNIWILNQTKGKWEKKDFYTQGTVKNIAYDNNNTFLIKEDKSSGAIKDVESFVLPGRRYHDNIPSLPKSLRSAAGTVMDGNLYIVGMSGRGVLHMFGLGILEENKVWIEYPTWNIDNGEIITSVVAHNDRLQVTIRSDDNQEEQMLQWSEENGWQHRGSVAGNIVKGTAHPIGQGHVLYLALSPDRSSAMMLNFHTITGSWYEVDRWKSQGISVGSGWRKGIAWIESVEGESQSKLSFLQLQTRKNYLSFIDSTVIVIYLIATLGVGLYSYLNKSTSSEDSYFLGNRSIPFWAAGISLYASNASSISYIAVPAKAFATNWQYLMSNIIVVIGLIFVGKWIVPLLRRLNLTSVFNYLESRFHPSLRVLSSILFIVFQLGGRMTVILYLPSLALSTVTGIDINLCIIVMGIATIIYTVIGGMKAVIWTDVLQFFVMFGGTTFAIVFILMSLDGGVSEFVLSALSDNKFELVDFSFNLTDATVWGFLFLVLFDTVLTFPKDQVLMQRVFSTSSDKNAGRSMWAFSAIVIPGSVMFFLVGTALYIFYQVNPERMDPSLSIDATFPLFISAELPVGVTGLIVAGIFAASMSTLSSILNSVATVSTVDLYEKFSKNKAVNENIRFAEIVTVVSGLVGVGLSLLLASYNIKSLLDVALQLWGLLGGGFAGAYTLGMFTKRANWQGVIVGVTVSFIVTFMSWTVDLVHPYFYLPLAVFVCIVVGYCASWLFPPAKNLDGLTIFSGKTQ
jgi:SSS family transporter